LKIFKQLRALEPPAPKGEHKKSPLGDLRVNNLNKKRPYTTI